MNKPENVEEVCYAQLPCPFCGKVCTWGYSYHSWWATSKWVLEIHKSKCEMNPESPENKQIRAKNKLISAIETCKTQARISECFNCKHFQEDCDWTKIKKQDSA